MPSTAVIQVTNLSSSVNSEQLRTLFGFLGDIEELRLYPPDNTPLSFSSKVCYIKYKEPSSVGVAQHLTNTVFIDRALIVVPCAEGKIPEEAKALSLLAPAAPVPSLMPGGGLLPIPSPAPLQNQLSLPLAARGPLQLGVDSLSAASSQPPIMGNVDPSKIDEIRRTVYVGNLNSQTTTAEQLLEFFKQVGEVKFVRMAGDETQPTRFAFVEFVSQDCVARALALNGVMFGDRPLKINHSNNAIVKPPELTPQAAAKELEDVMKRVREAQSSIAAAIDPAPIGDFRKYQLYFHRYIGFSRLPLLLERLRRPTLKSARPADHGNQDGPIPDLALILVLTHNGNAPGRDTGDTDGEANHAPGPLEKKQDLHHQTGKLPTFIQEYSRLTFSIILVKSNKFNVPFILLEERKAGEENAGRAAAAVEPGERDQHPGGAETLIGRRPSLDPHRRD
ncbi:Splicing regulatory glutamine/lysine-rich protein 1 [Bagarius yarrelli]|uniref:Splicing regulatory glutamine/lysine-rich protein 1 n=1 Tax=Bagarius yarrelli TaxID=175774 RepID=A0A556TY98_BAGYA|nr:Splicing regulatory glutamine/lysine-rich protein 1 [Bagarius yarrelli]